MRLRCIRCRRSCRYTWYKGFAEHFSADTQMGTARLVECLGPTVQNRIYGSAPLGEALLSFDSAVSSPSSDLTSPNNDFKVEQICFSSRNVYLWDNNDEVSLNKEEVTNDKPVPLYPCYFASGCPLLVQVSLTDTNITLREKATCLYVANLHGTVPAANKSCLYVHPFPKEAFEEWTKHSVASRDAAKEFKRLSSMVGAYHFLDISSVENEVLEMIDLPLSRLVTGAEQRHWRTVRAACGAVSSSAVADSKLDDVDGIPI